MRNMIIAGNWKMYKLLDEGLHLADEIIARIKEKDLDRNEVVLCTPFIHLGLLAQKLKPFNNVSFGAQNCHYADEGAFTGETSPVQIKSTGASYVIIGHSERRTYFLEKSEVMAAKISAAIKNDLKVIYCVGETESQREQEKHFKVVGDQVIEGIFHLTAEQMQQVVLAYEPVWAIGTGKTATPADAQEMHGFIRKLIGKKYGEDIASSTRILYGGSMKPENAAELLSQPDIDGGLIGGASLKADSFLKIIEAAIQHAVS